MAIPPGENGWLKRLRVPGGAESESTSAARGRGSAVNAIGADYSFPPEKAQVLRQAAAEERCTRGQRPSTSPTIWASKKVLGLHERVLSSDEFGRRITENV
jgi:hypothetical protein